MRRESLYQVIKSKLNQYFVDSATKSFIKHNSKIWNNKKKSQNDGEVLFELNTMQSTAIASSYLANVLCEKYNAQLVGYNLSTKNWKSFFGYLLKTNEKVYTSFGMQKVLYIHTTKNQRKQAERLFKNIYESLQSKQDVENITVDNILLGDLIYDSYLRKGVPTINLQDKEFIDSLFNSLKIYIFWKEYFDAHNIKAINVSHCVYNLAIPLRIAIDRDIPAFQVSPAFVYRLSQNNMFAYTDFKNLKEEFKLLSRNEQKEGLRLAKERIELRFQGKVGVDMHYSTKSAYRKPTKERLLKKSNKVKVFIALHCFFDSPHSYGFNLFPDFYEWLDFLGKISNETDYEWYLKTHPDYLPGNIPIVNQFLKKYEKFILLPSDSSHHQIIAEGINVALTTYGTIGFEYATLGVPVINASLNNPHIAYNFNIHPKNLEEYTQLLYNLESLDLEIDKNEVYEYYFMRHLYRKSDWLFEDHKKFIESLGGYKEQFTSKVYLYWMERFDLKKHQKIIDRLNLFIDSKDFVLDNKYI